MRDSVEIIPVKQPMECLASITASTYYGVHLCGTNKWLHPRPNEFFEGTVYLFNSEHEAEEAIAKYFGHHLYGAL